MNSRPIGFWLRLVDRLINERFTVTLDEHGVTRRQWQLLNVLNRGPSTQEQLDAAVAPFLDADSGESSAEHLAELVESEWVLSGPGGYELTTRGRSAFTRLEQVVTEQRTEMAAGVTAPEYEQTIAVLERMARNMGWTEG